MRQRPRVRSREPPRYRRRSPPPASSRRLGRRSPSGGGGGGGFVGRRSSPERRRLDKSTRGGDGRLRSRADILFEAGRLAAEYLVSKGVLPEDSLPSKGSTAAGAGDRLRNGDLELGYYRGMKRGDAYNDNDDNADRLLNDLRRRRSEVEEERMRRRSGSDKRKRNGGRNGGDGFDSGFSRRRRRSPSDEFRSRSTSRSYDRDRDRHSWGEERGDLEAEEEDRRRGRSRSGSYFSRPRDSRSGRELDWDEWRDCSELSNAANCEEKSLTLDGRQEETGHGDLDDDVSGVERVAKRSRSSLTESNDNGDQNPATDAKNSSQGNPEHASEAKNDENAEDASINSSADGTGIPECEPPDASIDHSPKSMEEQPGDPQHKLISNIGTDTRTDNVQEDLNSVKPVSEIIATQEQTDLLIYNITQKNSCSHGDDAIKPPKVETETSADICGEKQHDPPASFRIFDLNFVETHEMSEISNDPSADHLGNSVPDLTSGEDILVNCNTSQTHCSNGDIVASHHLDNSRTIPIINLEDDYDEQYDTQEFSESKSEKLPNCMDNILGQQEHLHTQDQHTSSFSDLHRTNISASPSIKPNLGNLWTGKSTMNAQGIPGEDDVLYVAFDKIPLEVINVWDLPSSELGESL